MSEIRRRPYGRASTERFRLRDATTGQFASATALVAGNVQLSIDGSVLGNVTNLPTFVGTNGQWSWNATAAEMSGARSTLVISNAAYVDLELRFELEGDARAQHKRDGQFHSTAISGVTQNQATLTTPPATLPDGVLYAELVDATGVVLATTYVTIAGSVVTFAPALAAAFSAVLIHLFALPKETSLASVTIGTVNTVTNAVATTRDTTIDAIAGAIAALPAPTSAGAVATAVANAILASPLNKIATDPGGVVHVGGYSSDALLALQTAMQAAVLVGTDLLDANPDGSVNIGGFSTGVLNAIADALLDRANGIGTNLSLRAAVRGLWLTAGVGGRLSGLDGGVGTNTYAFFTPKNNVPVLTGDADRYGNRLTVPSWDLAVLANGANF